MASEHAPAVAVEMFTPVAMKVAVTMPWVLTEGAGFELVK